MSQVEVTQLVGYAVQSYPEATVVTQLVGYAVLDVVVTDIGRTVQVISNGTWSDADSFTYQWYRGATPIGGATTASYVIVADDVGENIKCAVTGVNTSGSATADSNVLGPMVDPA